ncbi:MAG TPA: response regulator transcription factor [Pseudonocardiaceae bacterium]|jgi:DNA-binding NarL/FixJ family response regulator|nr:response regulator transcription factor [Pseudonocardiaceae bacterium]
MIRDAPRDMFQAEPDLEVVAVARDADEAIALAEAHLPVVAVMDVRMPGGGGARATREIRVRSPRTQLLAFSAYSDAAAMAEMLHVGAREYLVKGAPNDEILAAVRRLDGTAL